jgi:heavy metal sensor kinase
MIRRPRTLRQRLTAYYAGVLAVALALYGALMFIVLRRHAYAELDHRLQEDIELAVRQAELGSDGLPHWRHVESFAVIEEEEEGGHWAETWTAAGELVLAASTAEALSLGPAPTADEAAGGAHSGRVGARELRLLTRPARIGGAPFLLRAAISEAPLHARLRELLSGLVVAFPAVLGVAVLGGLAIAGRALRPLSEMAARARRITAERLSERLDPGAAGGELAQLATAFNEAFLRLEASFEQLRRFTADASHELRTPLTALRSVGEVGLAPGRSAAQYREVVASMLEEVDRLTRLVDALLQLSRGEAGGATLALEPLEAWALARDVAAQIAVLAEERGQQLACGPEVAAPVRGDRIVLRMALMNLINNAIEYGPVGGRVEVETTATRSEVTVAVRDEGRGIATEHQERVFDLFFRIDRDRTTAPDGAGLGLALARWAAQAHGGRIELQSAPGTGSTFRLILPRAEDSARK